VLGVSSMVAGVNFIVTILNMRAPGMTLMRMPLFVWMTLVVQFLIVLAFPPVTVGLVFLTLDRFFGTLGNHLTRTHESPQRAEHLHVEEVRRMEIIIVPIDTPLDTGAKLRLEQAFSDRGGINDDHADSRSLRMISAAGVVSFTRVRAWSRASISSRVGSAAIRSISTSR